MWHFLKFSHQHASPPQSSDSVTGLGGTETHPSPSYANESSRLISFPCSQTYPHNLTVCAGVPTCSSRVRGRTLMTFPCLQANPHTSDPAAGLGSPTPPPPTTSLEVISDPPPVLRARLERLIYEKEIKSKLSGNEVYYTA